MNEMKRKREEAKAVAREEAEKAVVRNELTKLWKKRAKLDEKDAGLRRGELAKALRKEQGGKVLMAMIKKTGQGNSHGGVYAAGVHAWCQEHKPEVDVTRWIGERAKSAGTEVKITWNGMAGRRRLVLKYSHTDTCDLCVQIRDSINDSIIELLIANSSVSLSPVKLRKSLAVQGIGSETINFVVALVSALPPDLHPLDLDLLCPKYVACVRPMQLLDDPATAQ
jgi:hypothetical protein